MIGSQYSPEIWVGLLLATGIAGVVRGFSGFGAGLVLAPSLALLLGPRVGLPVMIVLEIVASVRLVPEAYRNCRWSLVLPLGGAAVTTIPLGVLLLQVLDPTLLQQGIALLVLMATGLLASGWTYSEDPSWPMVLGMGALSGLLTGVAGVGGPPVVLVILAGTTAGKVARSDLIAFFSMTQMAALISLFFAGLLKRELWPLWLGLGLVFLLSLEIGSRCFRHGSDRQYRTFALLVLTTVAVVSLLASFW